MTPRPGSSLAELVLVAWLFALVLGAAARFAGAQGRLSAEQHARTRVAEGTRAASLILESELRYLTAADVHAAAAESVRIRAFRGGGVVCGSDGPDLLVRYRGVRLPNPDKDSVVLATDDDAEDPTFAVAGVTVDSRCGGALRLTLGEAPLRPRGVALVYETGAYHLAGGALRYRAGAAGRQPLTEALFAGPGFSPDGTTLYLGLEIVADSLPRLGPVRYDLPLRTLHPWPP